MKKIQMKTPIVEMDGDEMTRVLWKIIKEELIYPFIDLNSEYYDLGLQNRDATNDQITIDASNATLKYGVAVKCATITPNADRVKEYNLKKMWKSPNGTIRAILDGTVFRSPIIVKGINPFIPTWTKPIIIARHAYGDIYKATELKVKKDSKAFLSVENADGSTEKAEIHSFADDGIILGQHNTDKSIYSFATSCFEYALSIKQDLWFSTKDTISKTYDHRFKDIFNKLYETKYKALFEKAGITYFYTLIDDAVARVIRSNGGFIWALKNYDGDVMSDMIATAFGDLAMMTSVLVSPNGVFEFEAAHGTVTKHYYQYQKGIMPSTNSIATIFAWTGALRKRGELDDNKDLIFFADSLEKASIQTIEEGVMTKSLSLLSNISNMKIVNAFELIQEIKTRLVLLLNN